MTLISAGYANPEQGLDMLADWKGPFPSRSDTMSLNTLQPRDTPRGAVRERQPKESLSLRTDDIDGATPSYSYHKYYLDGPAQKDPIEGSRPKPSCWDPAGPPPLRPIDLSLTTKDIEFCRPKVPTEQTSGRHLNPLTPRYQLASARARPPTPPPVRVHEGEVRDTLAFKGLTKHRILERDFARDPLECRDIEGTVPNHRQRATLRTFTPRDTSKIVERAGERIMTSKMMHLCATPRESHPLDPVYTVSVKTTHPFLQSQPVSARNPREAGFIEKSTPRVLHRDNGEPQASLVRADLPGAVPQRYKGAMPFSIYDPPEVTPYARYSGLDCSDIEGTQPGTRRGALSSFRTP